MHNNGMKKNYMISRFILVIITFIIFNVMFIHEDSSWIIISFLFSVIVFFVSYPSTIISKMFIKIGDRLDKRILRLLYYVIILPALTVFIFSGIGCILSFIYSGYPLPEDFAEALGQALFFLGFITIVIICVIIPYLQTLIVLFLRHFLKHSKDMFVVIF